MERREARIDGLDPAARAVRFRAPEPAAPTPRHLEGEDPAENLGELVADEKYAMPDAGDGTTKEPAVPGAEPLEGAIPTICRRVIPHPRGESELARALEDAGSSRVLKRQRSAISRAEN